MALETFNWQNGTQIEPAKVEIGGQSYNVSDAQYEGETPLSASNLNLMQATLLGNVKDNLDDDTKIPNCKAVKDVYSTTETKTNKVWIGDKPVYRKVLDVTNIGASGIEYNHGISNLGTLIDVYGFWDGIVDGRQPLVRTLPASDANNAYAVSIGDITDTNFKLHYGTRISGISHVYIVFEYTKTTN